MSKNKIQLDNNIFYYSKVTLLTQIKLYIYHKMPLWAIPPRQYNLRIVDPECNIMEIDLK